MTQCELLLRHFKRGHSLTVNTGVTNGVLCMGAIPMLNGSDGAMMHWNDDSAQRQAKLFA